MIDHTMLARVYALSVEAEAIKAEIIAMELDTTQRSKDEVPLNYGPPEFESKAKELRGIAGELQSLGGLK